VSPDAGLVAFRLVGFVGLGWPDTISRCQDPGWVLRRERRRR
jgi:hypothetical protein